MDYLGIPQIQDTSIEIIPWCLGRARLIRKIHLDEAIETSERRDQIWFLCCVFLGIRLEYVIHLFIHPSIHPSMHPSIHASMHASIHLQLIISMYSSIWWFPEMGVPPVIIHFHRILLTKTIQLLGYRYDYGKPPFVSVKV